MSWPPVGLAGTFLLFLRFSMKWLDRSWKVFLRIFVESNPCFRISEAISSINSSGLLWLRCLCSATAIIFTILSFFLWLIFFGLSFEMRNVENTASLKINTHLPLGSYCLPILFCYINRVITDFTNWTRGMITYAFYTISMSIVKFGDTIIVKTILTYYNFLGAIRKCLVRHYRHIISYALSKAGNNLK